MMGPHPPRSRNRLRTRAPGVGDEGMVAVVPGGVVRQAAEGRQIRGGVGSFLTMDGTYWVPSSVSLYSGVFRIPV
jgi:hypothetical protein